MFLYGLVDGFCAREQQVLRVPANIITLQGAGPKPGVPWNGII
jgi:hypothetical protein